MNVLSKMSPDDKVDIVLNGEPLQVSVGSILKVYFIMGQCSGGYDDFYYRLCDAYRFGREADMTPDIDDPNFLKHREVVFKVCLNDYYDNQMRKSQIKEEIEAQTAILLKLKSEYHTLMGEEYGN